MVSGCREEPGLDGPHNDPKAYPWRLIRQPAPATRRCAFSVAVENPRCGFGGLVVGVELFQQAVLALQAVNLS
jgi:hypothetical protein